jgi:uncharacterized protein YcnI
LPWLGLAISLFLSLTPRTGAAQVAVDPAVMEPTAWTRIAFRIINPGRQPWTRVRVTVPAAVAILGIAAPAGWSATRVGATDSTAPTITWHGGEVAPGGLEEFVFLGRLGADVRRRELLFPVDLTDAAGTTLRLRRGGDGAEPRILIAGTTHVSVWAAFALAGGAFGLAALAVVLALRRRGG